MRKSKPTRRDDNPQDPALLIHRRSWCVRPKRTISNSSCSDPYYERWFAWPHILFTAQVPLLVAVATAAYFFSLHRRHEYLPFLLSLGLFALSMAGLGISIFPDIVPGAVGIHEAAAPESSLIFMLVGAGFLIPIILAYTAYSYWVFRGKVGYEGYH